MMPLYYNCKERKKKREKPKLTYRTMQIKNPFTITFLFFLFYVNDTKKKKSAKKKVGIENLLVPTERVPL